MRFAEYLDLFSEAKDPKAYSKELFGPIYSLIDLYGELKKAVTKAADPDNKEALEASQDNLVKFINHLKYWKDEVEGNLFPLLARNDRIQYFTPFMRDAFWRNIQRMSANVLPMNTLLLTIIESLPEGQKILKKLKKWENKDQGQIDLYRIKQQIEHYFRDMSQVQTIMNYRFNDRDKPIEDVFGDLLRLENEYNAKAGSALDPEVDDPKSAKPLLKFTDSVGVYYEWVSLGESNCPEKERKVMGHCGSNPKSDDMWSLRRRFNKDEVADIGLSKDEAEKYRKPVLTFAVEEEGDNEYTLVESHGIKNAKPHEQYHEVIVELLLTGKITKIDYSSAYKPEACFYLSDLSPELKEKLDEGLDFDIEENSMPRFTEAEIKETEEFLKEFDEEAKTKYPGLWVDAGEEDDYGYDDEYMASNGIPWQMQWGVQIDPDEFGVTVPGGFTLWNYKGKTYEKSADEIKLGEISLGGDIEVEWNDYSDTFYVRPNLYENEVYPENDNLKNSVEYFAEDTAVDAYLDIIENFIPTMIRAFSNNSNPKVREIFEKITTGDLEELENAEYDKKSTFIEKDWGLFAPIYFTMPIGEGRIIDNLDVWNKDTLRKINAENLLQELLPYDIFGYDPNQLELDLSSYQKSFEQIMESDQREYTVRPSKDRIWWVSINDGRSYYDRTSYIYYTCFCPIVMEDDIIRAYNSMVYVDNNLGKITRELDDILTGRAREFVRNSRSARKTN